MKNNPESTYSSTIVLFTITVFPYFISLIYAPEQNFMKLFNSDLPRIASTMLSLRTSIEPEHTK